MVIMKNKNFCLGIEVDGFRYHSSEKAMLKDADRQMYIEAKGYRIYRISEIS